MGSFAALAVALASGPVEGRWEPEAAADPVAELDPAEAEAEAEATSGREAADAMDEQLFEQGRRAYLRGDYGSAIVAFRQAYERSGDPNLLYNIALAYDRLSAFDAAIEYLERFRDTLPEGEREEVETRIAGLRGRREAERIEAEAAGRAGRGSITPPPSADRQPPEPRAEPRRAPSPLVTPTHWALAGVGLGGLAVGVGMGAASWAAARDARGRCATAEGEAVCLQGVDVHLRRARERAIAADVALAFGGVAMAAWVVSISIRAARRRRDAPSLARTGR